MALPKQVQAQVDEANKLASELYPDTQTGGDTPSEGESTLSLVENEGEGGAEASSDTHFEAEGAAEVAEVDGDEGDEDEGEDEFAQLEQRHRSLQGMYNSEKRVNAEQAARIVQLEQAVASLQHQPSGSAASGTVGLTSEDEEAYGADFIETMKRAALDAVRGDLEKLRAENQQLRQVVGGVGKQQETNAYDTMLSSLDTQVQGWRDLNEDQAFLDWLDQVDVFAGATRRDLFGNALAAHDVPRVAAFFNKYKTEAAAIGAVSEQVQPTPRRGGTVGLDTMVSPGASAPGGADATSGQDKMWRESDIQGFYDQVRKGAYKGREADKRRVEQSIHSAAAQGKVLRGQ